MCRDRVDAHTGDKDRCAGGRHDDIVCGSRNTHAQNNTGEHRQEERNDLHIACDRNDRCNQDLAQTSHRDDARDNARDAARNRNRKGALAAALQRIHKTGRGHTGILVNHADRDCNQRRDDRCAGHGEAFHNHPDEDNQREQQISLLEEQLAEFRQRFFIQALQSEFFRLEMDHHKDTCKVKERREDRLDRDRTVLNTNHFRHQERCRAHDWRHDLSSR